MDDEPRTPAPSGKEWIVIPNWLKFQHYGRRRSVPWVKLYLELNSKDEWLDLSVAARGTLVTIWIEYARSDGALRVRKVMQLCGKSARSVHLEQLNHAGFIEFSASKPASTTRAREKKSTSYSSKTTAAATAPRRPSGMVNMPPRDTEKYVRGLIRNGALTEPYEIDAYAADLSDTIRDELRGLLH